MIDQDTLRGVIFRNYADFIKFAHVIFPRIERQGILCEELVNEAIVNIFDVKDGFASEENAIIFIKQAIKAAGYHEKDCLKDINFHTQRGEHDEYSKLDKLSKPIHIDLPSDEFIKIYGIFERYRFGLKNEKRFCNKCKCEKFYNTKRGLECAGCGYKQSITARTYISDMKLKYAVFYKIVTILCRDQKISSRFLAKRIKVSQKTAWNRKHLIISVIANIDKSKRSQVFYKILTCVDFDEKKVELLPTNKNNRKFLPEEIYEIKRLRNDRVCTAKEIAEIYFTDVSTIYKIVKGFIYKDVA